MYIFSLHTKTDYAAVSLCHDLSQFPQVPAAAIADGVREITDPVARQCYVFYLYITGGFLRVLQQQVNSTFFLTIAYFPTDVGVSLQFLNGTVVRRINSAYLDMRKSLDDD